MFTNIPLTKREDLHSFVPLKRKRKKTLKVSSLAPQECEETYVYFQILGIYHPPSFTLCDMLIMLVAPYYGSRDEWSQSARPNLAMAPS